MGNNIARHTPRRYKGPASGIAGAHAWLRRLIVTVEFQRAVPVFRIFSLEKAREFYLDFLGFQVEWEHRFTPDAPVFMQVSRGGLAINLSEHHGDGTPGSVAYVYTTGVKELHRELNDKNYRHNRPGLQEQEWGMTEMTVTDPFNNRITFGERTATAAG
jgi:catechol 2,3-dioxygenase-like lactoylglutathione lyase family enzyme